MNDGAALRRSGAAVALTAAAGFVDAFGYMTFNRVFTANMSGNTLLVGVEAFSEPAAALRHAFTIAVFVAGLVAAGVAIATARRRGRRRVLALAMLLEALCLTALAVGSGPLLRQPATTTTAALYALLGLTALAMGIQNTALRRARVLSAYTTHVTGSLTQFGEGAVDYLQQWRRPGDARPPLAPVLFPLGLWAAFLCGAGVAAATLPPFGSAVLALPIAAVAAVGGLDWAAPLEPPET